MLKLHAQPVTKEKEHMARFDMQLKNQMACSLSLHHNVLAAHTPMSPTPPAKENANAPNLTIITPKDEFDETVHSEARSHLQFDCVLVVVVIESSYFPFRLTLITGFAYAVAASEATPHD